MSKPTDREQELMASVDGLKIEINKLTEKIHFQKLTIETLCEMVTDSLNLTAAVMSVRPASRHEVEAPKPPSVGQVMKALSVIVLISIVCGCAAITPCDVNSRIQRERREVLKANE